MNQREHATLNNFGSRTGGINAPLFDGSQLCAQSDPDSFFPEKHTNTHEAKAAIRVCHNCHFKEPCLEYALKEDVWGIWGGKTERQRRFMKRQLRVA
jgi:WhiB family redox-sensing transcriptional regulator